MHINWCLTLVNFGHPDKILSFSCSQRILTYLVFTYFGFECTFWKLFQKRVVFTKFYICVFITFFSIQFQLYRGSVTLVGGGNGVPWWSTESKWQTSIHKVVSSTLQYDCGHDNPRLTKCFAWMINLVLQKFQLLNTVYHFHFLPFPGYGTDSNKLVQRMTAKGVEDLA